MKVGAFGHVFGLNKISLIGFTVFCRRSIALLHEYNLLMTRIWSAKIYCSKQDISELCLGCRGQK